MLDLEKLSKWDAGLKRIETAPLPLLEQLYREVMDVRQAREAADRQTGSRRQESRAA